MSTLLQCAAPIQELFRVESLVDGSLDAHCDIVLATRLHGGEGWSSRSLQ